MSNKANERLEMGYADYCLDQLHCTVLISASLILDSISQECAVLEKATVLLEHC